LLKVVEKLTKIVKRYSKNIKSRQKVVKKLSQMSKSCQKVVKNVKKLLKISQKFVQKFVNNVSQKFGNNLPFCSDCPGKKKKKEKRKRKKKIGGSQTRWRLRRTW
jgi:monomeric isocitrate dehydrogenase